MNCWSHYRSPYDVLWFNSRILGYKLWNFLVAVTGLLAIVLMLSICWSQCAKDDTDQEVYKEEENAPTRRVIMAEQIGRGVMLVRGKQGPQVYAAVNDGSLMRTHMLAQQYQAAGYGAMDYYPPVPPPPPAVNPPVNPIAPNLIDLDPTIPPPYSSPQIPITKWWRSQLWFLDYPSAFSLT